MLIVSACSTKTDSGATSSDAKPQAGGTLNIGLNAETDGWDPTSSQWAVAAYYVGESVFDPLVVYGTDKKVHPYLAESITPSPDYTSWTIKLRPNIKFHDGTPLNSDAVKLLIDKDVASFLVGQAFKSVASTEIVDPLTVKVNMKEPWVAFPAALTAQGGMVAAPAQLNADGAAKTDKPIGTGPYIFKEWVRDDHLTVTKNPNYWRKDVAFPDTITFRPIPDDQTRLASVQSGQLDLTFTQVASQILSARRDSSLQLGEYDADTPTMMMMNMAVAPIDDVRVRQALALATDQQELNKTVGRGLSKVATEPYLPNSPWYVDSGYPETTNVSKAKGLIDAYKKDKGITGDIKFTVGCTPTPTNTQSMELIKNQWAKIGVSVDLKYTEQATYINNALNGDYTVNCWNQLGQTDPDQDTVWWDSSNANPVGSLALNFMRMKDPQIDAAIKEGHSNPDPQARKRAYGEIWKRQAELVPYAYTNHAHGAIIWAKSRVHNIADATLPDGAKQQIYGGGRPQTIPLYGVWVSQ